MKYYSILYITTLVIMAVLDGLWIGYLARDFYKNRMGDLLEFHAMPAVIFYIIYTAGILIFASASNTAISWQAVAVYAALLGFFGYATYDLTNLATLRNWSVSLVLVDIVWGIINTTCAATGGWLIAKFFK